MCVCVSSKDDIVSRDGILWHMSRKTSGPQLVYQRPLYVLFCLWKSAYKRSLAAYRRVAYVAAAGFLLKSVST